MTTKKAYTVTDLGPGDGGKGGVVHKLCALRKPHTVIKVGGSQGSHGVRTSAGEVFNFSQFGCGTFNGAKTHISDRFVWSPLGIINEAHALQYECGVLEPFRLLTIDENALCATFWHGIASRLRELARKDNPRGTVGVGIGETFIDSQIHPELALYARDLYLPNLRERLEAIRLQKIIDLDEILKTDFLENDKEEAREHIELLNDPRTVDSVYETLRQVARLVKIVDGDYIRREIFARDGNIVFESSHGVLTDRYYGFSPHTSRLRTIPNITTWDMFEKYDYDGEIVKLGVTRAYQIRHGAGPMVTDGMGMVGVAGILPEEAGRADRYRGEVRVGPLDFVSLRYAVNVCGGPKAFDGIAVTWFDRIYTLGSWQYATRYEGTDEPEFFSKEGDIIVHCGSGEEQIRHQERLAQALYARQPKLQTYLLLDGVEQKETIDLCKETFDEQLGLPVRMISFGPTENDKVLI